MVPIPIGTPFLEVKSMRNNRSLVDAIRIMSVTINGCRRNERTGEAAKAGGSLLVGASYAAAAGSSPNT